MGKPLPIPNLPLPRPRHHNIPSFYLIVVAGLLTLSYLSLSLSPCLIGYRCYHGHSSPFSFDADLAHNPSWMAPLPDPILLSSLSIPGTHDTMTYSLQRDMRLQCQNYNISTQLRAGIRYFDIRARLLNDELSIYHANGFTGFSYSHVLLQIFNFLDENPSEAVIMRLKQEGPPIGNNTRSFEEALNYHHNTSPLTSPGAAKHFHSYNPTAPIPSLGALRSKIFLLQEFPSEQPQGLTWNGPRISLEDLWIIPDVYHLADKWTAIRDHLEKAATSPLNDDAPLYLSHVSASVGVLPIEAAAGPVNRTVVGMNDMTGQWLNDFRELEGVQRVGIVIFDFPGRQAIDAVLKWNDLLPEVIST